MMEFFIFIGALGLLMLWASKSSKLSTLPCKLHKWQVTYEEDNEDKHGRLKCDVCGQLPGEE